VKISQNIMTTNPDIRSIKRDIAEEWFKANGHKTFRFKQLEEWLWKKCVRSFDNMTNFPKNLRTQLAESFSFQTLKTDCISESKDGTFKLLFNLFDGEKTEGVLIPSGNRNTACLSTQAGCQLACNFCATGQYGFKRDLTFTEILDQLAVLNELALAKNGRPVTNIVFMGMGEPLLNYEEVNNAISYIIGEHGLAKSPSRITLSTVGIPEGIRKAADDNAGYHLAISLHAANDRVRSSIIPIAKKYSLAHLSAAIKYFHEKTGSRIIIEYLLLGGVNDLPGDAAELALFCRSFPVKVNLISYNPVPGLNFRRSSEDDTMRFKELLESKNMVVNYRRSRGSDIAAACGQLVGK